MTEEINSQLKSYSIQPSRIQKDILDKIEKLLNGDTLETTNDPFNLLLEASATSASNAIIEGNSILRRKFPNLALNADELYPHLGDDQLANLFAVPASTKLTMFVSIVDIKRFGYRPDGSNYRETTIPAYTEYTVLGTPLTLLNDVVIRLYDSGETSVEMLPPELDIGDESTGVIDSTIYHHVDQSAWILFRVPIKQVKRYVYNIPVTASSGLTKIVNLTNKYYFSNISYRNSNTNNEYRNIPKSHTQDYIDPVKACCYISVLDKQVMYKIPDQFLLSGTITGNVRIEVFETIGKTYIPINKLDFPDFGHTYSNTNKNKSTATIENIKILTFSETVIDGGKDNKMLSELRDDIIWRSTGDIDLPITDNQLTKYANNKGYEIIKTQDTVTNRSYIACRSLPDLTSNQLVFAKQDVFFNTAGILLSRLQGNRNIICTDTNILIKSNTVFQNVNGIISVCDNSTIDYIDSLSLTDKSKYLKENKFYYTPYYYLISKDENYSNSRVYDLDHPKITANVIKNKNPSFSHSVNVNQHAFRNKSNGYEIAFNVNANANYEDIAMEDREIQVKLRLRGTDNYVTYYPTYDEATNEYSFFIETDRLLDNEDNIEIKNGESLVATKALPLVTEAIVYFCSTDKKIKDTTNFLQDEITKKEDKTYVIFTKQILHLTVGIKLEHIYNKLYNVYTERKYKQYEEDIPLVYEKDVYQLDPITGSIYFPTEEEGEKKFTTKLLHKKGDPVLDENDQPLYKFRRGDNVLDENGNPIIDTENGVLRYIDILMLEYEFYLATNAQYQNYKELNITNLNKYITEDLLEINNNLLENTEVLYRSYKTCKNVIVRINNNNYSIPYTVTPYIVLYIQNAERLSTDMINTYINNIGMILDKHFDKNVIKLNDIREDIKKLSTDIIAVEIKKLDPNNSETLNIIEPTSKLVLNKMLETNKSNELVVKYNLNLDIIYT
ncbi:hypothetical protein ACVWU4_000883 [Campylobacter coli]